MKTILLALVITLGTVLTSYAQDKIVKTNGTVINGKVTEVGIREVKYQISQEANSARFVIRKAELQRIEFVNGQTVVFNERPVNRNPEEKGLSTVQFGKNIILLSPFKALDSGPGLGFSYERIVGENQFLGVIAPVAFMFNNDYYYDGSNQSRRKNSTNFYVSPGVKFYPFGQRKVTYAVGPNVMLGFTERINSQYIYGSNGSLTSVQLTPVKSFRLGLIVNNYLNFQITSKINLGINGGLGVRYFDRQSSNVIYNDGMQLTGEFAFNFGFRF